MLKALLGIPNYFGKVSVPFNFSCFEAYSFQIFTLALEITNSSTLHQQAFFVKRNLAGENGNYLWLVVDYSYWNNRCWDISRSRSLTVAFLFLFSEQYLMLLQLRQQQYSARRGHLSPLSLGHWLNEHYLCLPRRVGVMTLWTCSMWQLQRYLVTFAPEIPVIPPERLQSFLSLLDEAKIFFCGYVHDVFVAHTKGNVFVKS